MITVKLFGLFRLDTGMKKAEVETVKTVKEMYPILLEKAKEVNPKTKVTLKDLEGCIIVVDGKQVKKDFSLKEGDEVYLMSPVCGG